MRSDHEHLEDEVAAYALGVDEPGEAAAVRAHLDACPSCRELAGRLHRAVAALPLAVEEVTPPGRLRERILAAAGEGRSREAVRAPRLIRPRLPSRPRAGWLPAAAAAVLLLAAGAGAGLGLDRLLGPGSQVAARHFQLAGAGASASVVEFRGAGTTLVEFRGLAAPATGRVYELWLIPDGGRPVAAGVFVPDADGSKVLVLPRDLDGFAVMAVTDEPGPAGSPQPTGRPLVSGSV